MSITQNCLKNMNLSLSKMLASCGRVGGTTGQFLSNIHLCQYVFYAFLFSMMVMFINL